MTGYISTRYYRAPEVMLSWQRYDEKVDVWSAGCILAEMLLGRVLFPGRNHIHQFTLIAKLLGKPSGDLLKAINKVKVCLRLSIIGRSYADTITYTMLHRKPPQSQSEADGRGYSWG